MALIMPTPFKDKASGIYYLRVRVPVDLVSKYGRPEVSKSLRTREPSEAKERFAAEYAAIQKRWAALRAEPVPCPRKTHREFGWAGLSRLDGIPRNRTRRHINLGTGATLERTGGN